MSHWRQLLLEHDSGSERLDGPTAARMRRVVTRAATDAVTVRTVWPMRVALAGFAGVVLALSMFGTAHSTDSSEPSLAPGATRERRQIQFATPGGTRIIWELNSQFTLMETLP